MNKYWLIILLLGLNGSGFAQKLSSISLFDDVTITLDEPMKLKKGRQIILIFFALPNGNTTAQTMGKKLKEGDDWHFDIQHIKAQTEFIRKSLSKQNIIVAYLENKFKSWPSWKKNHQLYRREIPFIIDTVMNKLSHKKVTVYLNAHSGGGSFIFGYLDGVERIPAYIKRIGFIDSNYGYDSSYSRKFTDWLKTDKETTLTVFAYNDSVALYNGKKLVSATGGTWYRSHRMQQDLGKEFSFSTRTEGDIEVVSTPDKKVAFFYKSNPDTAIYHTQQVELNGFIHSVLFRTKKESVGYIYYGERAYGKLIE